jgi:hypothetical protein
MNRRLLPWLLLLCVNGVAWYFFVREKTAALAPSEQVSKFQRLDAHAPAIITNLVVRTNEFAWVQLESEDYQTYIERLRSIGCPEQTIHDIIIADLEKLMASRVREIEGRGEPPKYWQPSRKDLTSTLAALEKMAQKQEIDFEKREIVRELLGIDLASERARVKGEHDLYDQRLAFLPADTRGNVRMIMERTNQEEMLLREKSWLDSDELTAADQAELRAIQNRREEAIAALLSPEELERFNLWFSPTAYRVREAFLALEPNEDDFLALYRLQREFDQEWGTVHPASLDLAKNQEFTQAQAALDQEMREYLGDEKYQKLRNARDPDFRQLQATAVQFGLQPEVTGEIYDYRAALREERNRVKNNPGLGEPQKQAILRALSEETEQAVVEALGPRAYRYYIRNGAGQWIWDSH